MCDMRRCTSITQPVIQVMHIFILCASRSTSNTVVVTHYIFQAIASFDGVEGDKLIVESDVRCFGYAAVSSFSFRVLRFIARTFIIIVGVTRGLSFPIRGLGR